MFTLILSFMNFLTRRKFSCTLLVFLLTIIVINYSYANNVKFFRWVDDENYPPLIYLTEDGKPAGIFYEVMTEAFRRLNIPLKVELYPWVRAQKIVYEGKADGMVTVLTKERKKLFIWSVPILKVCEYIFTNKNNPHIKEIMSIQSLEEIKPFKIVEVIGARWTKETLKGFDITWVTSLESAFNMLAKNRVDIFLLNNFVGGYFLKERIKEKSPLYGNIVVNKKPIKIIPFRLFVRKESQFARIIEDFNKAIYEMQKDGTIKHIIASQSFLKCYSSLKNEENNKARMAEK